MSEFQEFVQRPDVVAALEEVGAEYAARFAAGEEEPDHPDVHALLRDKGIEPPEGASLRLIHTVAEENVKPMRPICEPEGVPATPVGCDPWPHCTWVCP